MRRKWRLAGASRHMLAVLLSVAMAVGTVPTAALAEVVDEIVEEAAVEEVADGEESPTSDTGETTSDADDQEQVADEDEAGESTAAGTEEVAEEETDEHESTGQGDGAADYTDVEVDSALLDELLPDNPPDDLQEMAEGGLEGGPMRAAATFTRRTTRPSSDNGWFYSSKNPYYAASGLAPKGVQEGGSYVVGNCTWYAWGRAAEALGEAPNIAPRDPAGMWADAKSKGVYETGSVPRAGSLVIGISNTGNGHVAFVEYVEDGVAYVSESGFKRSSSWPGYGGISFHTGPVTSWMTGGITGYIYLPLSAGSSNPTIPDWSKFGANAWPADGTIVTLRSAVDPKYTVEVPDASTANQANIAIHTRNLHPCQQWRIKYNWDIDDGSYALINVSSGKALENYGANPESGANISQFDYNGSDAQMWYICACSDGTVAFQNRASGLWLDVAGAVMADGTNVQQHAFVSSDNNAQKFYMHELASYGEAASFSGTPFENSWCYIHSALNQAYVLDVYGASEENGAGIAINQFNGGTNQQFKFVANTNGTYRLVARHSGKAIEMPNLNLDPRVQLHQWADGTVAQRSWYVQAIGSENVFAFRNGWSDLFMDLRDAAVGDGSAVAQDCKSNSDAQRWVVVPVKQGTAATVDDGTYEIVSAIDSKSVITEEGTTARSELKAVAASGKNSQRFTFTKNDDGTYLITCKESGLHLGINDHVSVTGTAVNVHQGSDGYIRKWYVESAGSGKVYLRNAHTGLYLNMRNAKVGSGSKLEENFNLGAASQKFTLRKLDLANATVAPIEDQEYIGSAQKPEVKVTFGGYTLKRGTHYTVKYANTVNPGTGTATITGMGDFTGTQVVHYNIVRVPIDTSKDGWVDLSNNGKAYVKNGEVVIGWYDIGDAKYYFNKAGRMITGWHTLTVDGKSMRYYFRPSGNLARGAWADIDGKKYYFRPSGNMATGWADIDGKKYYFDEQGQMVTGWQDIVNSNGVTNHYYFRPSGSMATGWAEIDGEHFYFRPSGNMATGFTDVPDDAYKRYFDEQGKMVIGWREIDGNTYYFRASGAMQTGEATIDGVDYVFSDKGVLVK